MPLGRGRRRLRGAAERDDRRRRAVPEVRQRDRAARLLLGGALERGARRGSPPRPPRPRACPRARSSLVAGGGREELAELAGQEGVVDLIIPRGGEGLKKALSAVAKVPVIYAASGNCHVFVDATADLERAEAIVLNAKTQRPGVCNAAETLLVHADVGRRVPAARALRALRGRGRRGPRRRAHARRSARSARAARGDGGGLGAGVPRAGARRQGRRLRRGGDRARQRATAPGTRRRS